MIEARIIAVRAEEPGREETAATRERLRERFPRGATRRMTQLGLLVGSLLQELAPAEEDTVVYASRFAENQALAEYLGSFPTPSPTLFQTSIHPSAVQQGLIALQRPVREVIPMSGDGQLAFQATRAALLANGRTLLCGGEERGSWLCDFGLASDETFAFAALLEPRGSSDGESPGLGRIALEDSPGTDGVVGLHEFARALAGRENLRRPAAPGQLLILEWR
jgi:hypothetical protein